MKCGETRKAIFHFYSILYLIINHMNGSLFVTLNMLYKIRYEYLNYNFSSICQITPEILYRITFDIYIMYM